MPSMTIINPMNGRRSHHFHSFHVHSTATFCPPNTSRHLVQGSNQKPDLWPLEDSIIWPVEPELKEVILKSNQDDVEHARTALPR